MLEDVETLAERDERLLLIDTCGETAGVALSAGERLVAGEAMERGRASAEIVLSVRRLLEQAGWSLAKLDAVGVVSGPGTFTGMRAGLAAAKGLCEAAGLPLVAVSRLAVLADAAGLRDGFAMLDAGRGELYVRDAASGREWVAPDRAEAFAGNKIAVAEQRLAGRLEGSDVVLRTLHAGDALGTVLRRMRSGRLADAALVDANYVRLESDLFRKPAVT